MQLRPNRATTTVFKHDLRLDRDTIIIAVEGCNQVAVLLRDNPSAHFTRPSQFTVIRIELFMQNEKALNLRPSHLWLLGQTRIHALDFALNQVVDL